MSAISKLAHEIGPLGAIRIESEYSNRTYIFDAGNADKLHALARKCLAQGDVVVWEDGTREWWNSDVDLDTSKSGSAMYTWAADGNRCRYTLNKYRRAKQGETTVKSSKVWRKLD